MRVSWTGLAMSTIVAGVGFAAVYAALWRALRLALAERQSAADRQIAALSAKVEALEAHLAVSCFEETRAPESESSTAAASARGHEKDRVKPEMLAAITAAATAFLGKNARVRSARLIQPSQETVSLWSQQGRVVVQTSHNLRARG